MIEQEAQFIRRRDARRLAAAASAWPQRSAVSESNERLTLACLLVRLSGTDCSLRMLSVEE
jgi:hypothetical protein